MAFAAGSATFRTKHATSSALGGGRGMAKASSSFRPLGLLISVQERDADWRECSLGGVTVMWVCSTEMV